MTGDLSKHFSRSEFACKCGCGFDTVDVELLNHLILIREYWQNPLVITSGCRCLAHNTLVGGHYNSGHMRAEAVDFYIKNIEPEKIYTWLHKLNPDSLALGNGKTFTHLGLSKKKKRWAY